VEVVGQCDIEVEGDGEMVGVEWCRLSRCIEVQCPVL
jgi:hypothetical protein